MPAMDAAHLEEIFLEVHSISVYKQERTPMAYMNCSPVGLGEGKDIWYRRVTTEHLDIIYCNNSLFSVECSLFRSGNEGNPCLQLLIPCLVFIVL